MRTIKKDREEVRFEEEARMESQIRGEVRMRQELGEGQNHLGILPHIYVDIACSATISAQDAE